MLSGLTYRCISMHKWCAVVFDKCLAYTMKFLMTVLLFLSYVKMNKSDVTLHSGIIIFSLCPNIYRKYYKCLTYKCSIWLTSITMWSIRSDIFIVQVQYLKGHGRQIFIKEIRLDFLFFKSIFSFFFFFNSSLWNEYSWGLRSIKSWPHYKVVDILGAQIQINLLSQWLHFRH